MELDAVVESVGSDAVQGCYVAAYATGVRDGAGRYLGYYKIFSQPATSYFSASPCIAKGVILTRSADAGEAVDRALAAARHELVAALAEDDAWAVLQYQ